jgi:hypothetical protein
MLACAVCFSFAFIVCALFALRTYHAPDLTGRPNGPLEYGGISMANALAAIGGAIVATVLYVAGIVIGTALVAGVAAYTVHAVWYW